MDCEFILSFLENKIIDILNLYLMVISVFSGNSFCLSLKMKVDYGLVWPTHVLDCRQKFSPGPTFQSWSWCGQVRGRKSNPFLVANIGVLESHPPLTLRTNNWVLTWLACIDRGTAVQSRHQLVIAKLHKLLFLQGSSCLYSRQGHSVPLLCLRVKNPRFPSVVCVLTPFFHTPEAVGV